MIAEKLGIASSDLIPFGHDKAKISADFIARNGKGKDGKLILVTAVSPTPAGEGALSRTAEPLAGCRPAASQLLPVQPASRSLLHRYPSVSGVPAR